jgi:formylglycine-generating enzyme required for sulfatase activity/tetratricopeptide (TPR) repeat protein
VSRIFLSHSSANNAEAVALRDWLSSNGWKDEIFLDLDPQRGIATGDRWERALNEAANRCEAVLFLVSKAWLASVWCRRELNLAHRLNKRLFGALIEDFPVGELPEDITGTWQIVRLASGRDHVMLRAVVPITHEEAHVTFSAEGLQRLKHGLEEAGLDPKYFGWPQNDRDRSPYRGLRPLEAEDAGIFFGRDGLIVEALDDLRGLRETTPPRLLIILGASGAGKSSFLRAGLFPRLTRDDQKFLPLPVIRPERAAISGETGLLSSLEGAFAAARLKIARADLRSAIQAGAAELRPLLQTLAQKAAPIAADGGETSKPPTLILSIDQGEELFLAEAQDEAKPFLALLRDLLKDDAPAVIAVFTIRSDNYERLQLAAELQGMRQAMLSLPPMPKGSYAEVIKGPARRLQTTARSLNIEDGLVDALLADIEAGGAKDALPLLAFTLERLYGEYHASGSLKLAHYVALGRIKGSIEEAVERALQAASADPAIPKDRAERLALLRRGLIPWLAGIDPDTGAPRRRVARPSEIPAEARPLIQRLVEQRLLATDVNKDTGESTIEPTHEALLRQWGLLQGWLTEDAGLLTVLEGVKRASRDWAAKNRNRAWLSHQTDRLAAAERLSERPDLAASFDPTDQAYIAACRKAETDAKRGRRLLQGAIYVLLVSVIVGLIGWINQATMAAQWRLMTVTWPYERANFLPYVLGTDKEKALKPGNSFKECRPESTTGAIRFLEDEDYCPEMVVVSAGSFMMGAPATESQAIGYTTQIPQHSVIIAKPFAISKYDLTFAEWDACVAGGGCNGLKPSDQGWGRGQQPVINVDWDDAQAYVAWLSQVTGKTYRFLSEGEYEYAARAGTTTAYPWGDDIKLNGQAMANCDGCGSKWDTSRTAPVGSFPANKFGLYDMVGNVWAWTEDCIHDNYKGAPTNGFAWLADNGGDCTSHAIRGGSWNYAPGKLRSAYRIGITHDMRSSLEGIRVARTLDVAALTEQRIVEIRQQQQLDWCTNKNNAFSSDLKIAGCTALIESGTLSGEALIRAYNRRADAFYDRGDYDNAITDLSEVLKLNPKNADAYIGRGSVYYHKRDYARAIVDYSEAIRINPTDATAYNGRGNAYFDQGDYDRAIVDYSEAIKLNPNDATVYGNRGIAYSDKGDYDGAIADFSEAIKLNPKDATTYDNRGLAYRRKGDLDRAIADYIQAIALDPKDAIAYFRRGFAYSRKGEPDRAIADYTQAIALDPKNPGALNNRCYDNAIIGQLQAALADCNQSLQLRPNDAGTLDSRGSTFLKLGQFDNAIADYNAALKVDPKTATSLYGRGVAEMKKGNSAVGDTDIAAAKAIQADVADQMAAFGVTL